MKNSGARKGGFDIKEKRKEIADHLARMKKEYGVDMICMSSRCEEFMEKLNRYSRSGQIVIFEGESGVGRSHSARIMQNIRNGGELLEFSCMNETETTIREIIKLFMKLPGRGKAPGLLIKNIDLLPEESFSVLLPVLQDFNGDRYIYMTARTDFIMNLPNLSDDITFRLKQLVVKTPPLRERSEDIVHMLPYFTELYARSMNIVFQTIENSVVSDALEYHWPGNIRELQNEIKKSILENDPPVLRTFTINRGTELSSDSGLSPLEESEKHVIINYLKKNKYNKNKTRLDLRITINTLNTKIKRYGISVPIVGARIVRD